MNQISSLIEVASKWEPITRVNGNGHKPRFISDYTNVFNSTLRWLHRAELEEPPYIPDSRIRDRWLQNFWRLEPFLAGVINSVTEIDANRGWTLTGGRNQVRKYTARLHDCAGGEGWRTLIKQGSLSFWTTDMNGVFGVRREEPWATLTEDGITKSPMLSLENIDPAECRLFRQRMYPEEIGGAEVESRLMYMGKPLAPWDYFRVVSMPSDIRYYQRLGFSALSRCLNLAKLLYAVYQYDQEKLLAKAPRGLLLLHNITEAQWNTAMEAREARMSAKEREYYGSVEVLASDGGEYNPDAKLVALSQLPDGFDQKVMTNLLIYGYAACFGYDVREFIPVSEGGLGTGRETAEQAQKATGKGERAFSLGFQDKLQQELPETIQFEFEERDDKGELLQVQVKEAKAKLIERLSGLREQTGAVLSNDQILELLAREQLIPEEWTLTEEDVTATDEAQVRAKLRENARIVRAAEVYPAEPIIRYSYPNNTERILWESGMDMLKPKVWSKVLYRSQDLTITAQDIKEALA
jgi:hypothetical protein